MCTGIVHVFYCDRGCGSIVYKLKEAAPGYTCRQARANRRRGVCRTGIDWSYYDRTATESCLYCELYHGGEIPLLTAETCEEGTEWPEDMENVEDDVDVEDGGAVLTAEYNDDSDEDLEDGGVRLH
ncbi:hypothetical protein GGS21DRAFT_64337 [Xylaria nigripes]|nr:hypothetical protein GGS21DRAFT_64337 [Xylaria nigripes]